MDIWDHEEGELEGRSGAAGQEVHTSERNTHGSEHGPGSPGAHCLLGVS